MKKHELEIVNKAPKLGFCSYCRSYLRDAYFHCSQKDCNESMCLRCGGGTDTSNLEPGVR